MLVAVPAALSGAESGQKWPEMALRFAIWPIRGLLLIPPGLNRFAAPSHSAGLRAACEPLHRRGREIKAIRL